MLPGVPPYGVLPPARLRAPGVIPGRPVVPPPGVVPPVNEPYGVRRPMFGVMGMGFIKFSLNHLIMAFRLSKFCRLLEKKEIYIDILFNLTIM